MSVLQRVSFRYFKRYPRKHFMNISLFLKSNTVGSQNWGIRTQLSDTCISDLKLFLSNHYHKLISDGSDVLYCGEFLETASVFFPSSSVATFYIISPFYSSLRVFPCSLLAFHFFPITDRDSPSLCVSFSSSSLCVSIFSLPHNSPSVPPHGFPSSLPPHVNLIFVLFWFSLSHLPPPNLWWQPFTLSVFDWMPR